MNNLDIHIVGLGNLGSSLLKGLKNLDNNLTFYLYEKEPDDKSQTLFACGGAFMVDDKMPAAYEEPWAVVTGASAAVINGDAEEDMFTYSYSHT